MMACVPFVLDSRSACFLVRNFSVSLSHVCPPLSWLSLYPVVFIYPSPIDASFCIPSLFSTRNLLNLHSAITFAHSRSPHSPFCFPNQGRRYSLNFHYNGFLSCPLTSHIPSGPCVCDIAIREQMGTVFLLFATLLSVLLRNLVYPSGIVFSFLSVLLAKATHKHRVFWIPL